MPTPLWNDRFSWSSEIPLTYPELNPVALNRVDNYDTGLYRDAVDTSRDWQFIADGSPVWWGSADGPRGTTMRMNYQDPASEQARVQLDHFSGLWPSSGRLLLGGWFQQSYTMSFNPLIDTRDTDPFVYLSTSGSSGQPRHQIYDASGSLILDQYESGMPWPQTSDWYFLGILVDLDAPSSRMFSVHSDGRTWLGPTRSISGTPNLSCTADVHVFSLRHANFWERGFFDEVVIAHPSASFDLPVFVSAMGHSVWADGQERPGNYDDIDVDESEMSWTSGSITFHTGAERLSWSDGAPSVSRILDGSGSSAYRELSYDDGETWDQVAPGNFPSEAEDVLWRWRLETSGTGVYGGHTVEFQEPEDEEVTPNEPSHDEENNTVTVTAQTGVIYDPAPGTHDIPEGESLTVTAEPDDGYYFPPGAVTEWTYSYVYPNPPTLDPIADISLEQNSVQNITLSYTAEEPYTWNIITPSLADATIENGVLSVSVGFETGTGSITVELIDAYDRPVDQTFEVEVTPMPWDDGPPPRYPHAPIVLWDGDQPAEVLIDPLEAIVTREVNGAETFTFMIPTQHDLAPLIYNENRLEAAGESYWMRRITSERIAGVPVMQVYCEARFYELGTQGGIEPQEWNQVLPSTVMETALAETDWSVGTVNVGTRRTYSLEERTNPLAVLRMVQENHGGDLIFDNVNRTVNLIQQAGRDQGVGFFYQSNLSESKRVIDTTSLVTRIYARNEDGLTIASVNNGVPYLEDYSYTDELKTATYNFKAGTSPFTMLEMTRATLANRSRPDVSYECQVADLSSRTHDDLDRFDRGDIVTVSDPAVGIEGESQRIVRLEYNLIEPWDSEITLSARLRERGSGDGTDGALGTGSTVDTFDLVPFNLLLNSRFDNDLAHWASSGAEVVETQDGSGDYAVRFEGSGQRWIEQTVTPDNRRAYAFSMELNHSGGPEAWTPNMVVEAEITYEDGEVETVELDLGGDPDAGNAEGD